MRAKASPGFGEAAASASRVCSAPSAEAASSRAGGAPFTLSTSGRRLEKRASTGAPGTSVGAAAAAPPQGALGLPPARLALFAAAALVYVVGVPVLLSGRPYWLNVLTNASMLSFISLGVWLTFAIGRINISQGAYTLIGGYATAILSTRYGLSFWLCLPLSGLIAAAFGALIGAAILRLRGVGRRFGGVVAVSDVDLDVRPGERRAILGPNGAGKTTLFNLISGEFPPSTGSVELFGDDVTAMPARKRARRGPHRARRQESPARRPARKSAAGRWLGPLLAQDGLDPAPCVAVWRYAHDRQEPAFHAH